MHVPERRQSGEQIEDRLRQLNPRIPVRPGVLRRLFGFESRTVAPAEQLPSDLAAAAARRVLDRAGLEAADVDLLLYFGISRDMIEPSTCHIVAAKAGLRCPAFDLANACNGFLNALEVADALIRAERYRRVLAVTGEVLSRVGRWRVEDRGQLSGALGSLVLGDLGAAALIEAADRPGILAGRFMADPGGWTAVTLTDPYAHHGVLGEVHMDPSALASSFDELCTRLGPVQRDLAARPEDLALACVHQPSVPLTHAICGYTGASYEGLILTFPDYGNVATASLPLQLALAAERRRLRRGDRVGLFGFAGGSSVGITVLRWS